MREPYPSFALYGHHIRSLTRDAALWHNDEDVIQSGRSPAYISVQPIAISERQGALFLRRQSSENSGKISYKDRSKDAGKRWPQTVCLSNGGEAAKSGCHHRPAIDELLGSPPPPLWRQRHKDPAQNEGHESTNGAHFVLPNQWPEELDQLKCLLHLDRGRQEGYDDLR